MILRKLSVEEHSDAERTISAWSFLYIVGDALLTKKPLSVVRMADGERKLYLDCLQAASTSVDDFPIESYTKEWRTRMGLEGIISAELHRRILQAAMTCDYFGISTSGFFDEDYNLYKLLPPRPRLVDNFYHNIWHAEAKEALIRAAGSVLLIHHNRGTGDSMQKQYRNRFDVPVRYLQLTDWRGTEDLIKSAQDDPSALVLFSAGPAGKYIAAEIVKSNKVALDIGASVDSWTFGVN